MPLPDVSLPPAKPAAKPGGRIVWLDIAKGGSILLVVIYHVTLFMTQSGFRVAALETFNSVVGPIRMPLFFMVSGLFSVTLLRPGQGRRLSARVKTMAYLFFLWSAIAWVCQLLLIAPMRGIEPEPVSGLLMAWFAPISTLWFLWGLVLYTLLTRLFASLRILGLAFGLGCFWLSLAYGQDLTFSQASLLRYLMFFQLGAWGRDWIFSSFEMRRGWWLVAGLAFFPLGAAITQVGFGSAGYMALRLAMSFAGIALAFCLCALLARSAGVAMVLCFLGRRTLPIYVMHTMLAWPLVLAAAGVPALAAPGPAHLTAIAITAAIIAACTGLRRLLDRMRMDWLFRRPELGAPSRAAA